MQGHEQLHRLEENPGTEMGESQVLRQKVSQLQVEDSVTSLKFQIYPWKTFFFFFLITKFMILKVQHNTTHGTNLSMYFQN